MVAREIQALEVGQGSQFERDGPAKSVELEFKPFEIGEAAQFGRDGPAQLVECEMKPSEISEAAQFGRNGPAELVASEIQPLETGKQSQFPGDGPSELVSRKIQALEVGQGSQFERDGPAKSVGLKFKPFEIGEAAQFGRNGPAELVVYERQRLEAGQLSQFRGDGPAELVSLEIEPFEIGEAAQFGRNGSAELVVDCLLRRCVPPGSEIQPFQMVQMAQRRRDGPAQPVAAELQARDLTGPVRLHPEPLPERCGAQPVGVVRPVRPAGGLVERLQHLPVRQLLASRIDDRHPGRVGRHNAHPRWQRSAESQHHRLGVVVMAVLDSHETECPRTGRSRDDDMLRHPRIVGCAPPAFGDNRQGEPGRAGRPVGLIDQAHRHRDAPTLSHLIGRRREAGPQGPVAGQSRGSEVVKCVQPCLEGRRYADPGSKNIQPPETRQLNQVWENLPHEWVAREIQPREVGEVAQFRRDHPAQLVAREMQHCEVGEVAQFRRDHPAELIARETQ